MRRFIGQLALNGRAVVAAGSDVEADEAAWNALQELEARARMELVRDPPQLSRQAALWAAEQLYHACRFVACRDIHAREIESIMDRRCPEPRGPSTDWSVDLHFRHLPALYRLARHLSQADPLVTALRELAGEWPLSSVGIPELSQRSIESFVEHDALRRLYADRIMAEADSSRLGDERVDDQLRIDLGAHRDAAPALAARLFPEAGPAGFQS